jgi:hypothetical protein
MVTAIALVGADPSQAGSRSEKAEKVVPVLRSLFVAPTAECRPLIRWWWFGSAVTNREIERELTQMRDAGFGGVEIQPVYPLALDDSETGLRNLPYLSSDFLASLSFAIAKASELGLTVDVAAGGAGTLGGPHTTPEQGARTLLGKAFLWPSGALTGEQVGGAAVAAEGLVLDPYGVQAVASHLAAVGEKLLAGKGASQLHGVVSSAPTVTSADWTGDFAIEFKRRRGYDIAPLLARFTAGDEAAATARHDWALTLSELLDERYFAQLQAFSRRHGVALRTQVYGTLPINLASVRFADIPEGSGVPWNSLTATRLASSGARLYGKPIASAVIGASAQPSPFSNSPLDLKVEADQQFLAGATQIVGHGWPYSPEQAGRPGWTFENASAISPQNPWWPVMPELTMHLRRMACVLRQGDAVTDVAIYLPTHDALAALKPGDVDLGRALADRIGPEVIPIVLRAGFSFDLIDDDAIRELATKSGDGLVPGKHRYSVVILPGVERIPLSTLQKLQSFAQTGGSLIATRAWPSLLPSAREQERNGPEFAAALAKLVEPDPKIAAKLVLDEPAELGGLLRKLVQPDLRTATMAPQIGFVHRRMGEADLYFIANTWNVSYNNTIELRVPPRAAEWWDPVSGNALPAQAVSTTPSSSTFRLVLPAYASTLLVVGVAPWRGKQPKAAAKEDGPPEEPVASMDISNGWDIAFEGTPIRRNSDWLTSWTESADTRNFSGEAVYRKTVAVLPRFFGARKVTLSLGEAMPSLPPTGAVEPFARAWLDAPVRVAAVVFVNSERVGCLWQPPYELDLNKHLRTGANEIEIRVFNLAINQLAGKPLPDYSALNAKYGVRFKAPGGDQVAPVPSGLFGPISLAATD